MTTFLMFVILLRISTRVSRRNETNDLPHSETNNGHLVFIYGLDVYKSDTFACYVLGVETG